MKNYVRIFNKEQPKIALSPDCVLYLSCLASSHCNGEFSIAHQCDFNSFSSDYCT